MTQLLLRWVSGKESTCQCGRCRRRGFSPWVREIPWRRGWQPTPVFLPGGSHGQRNLAGCSPGSHRELDGLSTHTWKAVSGQKFCKPPALCILYLSTKSSFSYIVNPSAAAATLLQSCPTLCDPIDSSPPGSSVPGILQARTLEWGATSFSRGSSRPRDRTQVSRIAG